MRFFTSNELVVLGAMYQSAKGNGFDFGIMEEISENCPGMDSKSVQATLRVLHKKVEYKTDDGGPPGVTQFYIDFTAPSTEKQPHLDSGELDFDTSFADWMKLLPKPEGKYDIIREQDGNRRVIEEAPNDQVKATVRLANLADAEIDKLPNNPVLRQTGPDQVSLFSGGYRILTYSIELRDK